MVKFRASATVSVPATSANLGPGFDALGLALDLCDEVTVSVVDSGLQIDVAGEGADFVPRDERHLVVRAMFVTFDRLGGRPPGLVLECTNRVPHSRGLGSSAAAIVAGVLLARALVEGGDELLPDAGALGLAAEIEGHPDNVAACLLGGLSIAWTEAGAHAVGLAVAPEIVPVVLVPPFTASTEQARGLLPSHVSHGDAAANAGRAALQVAALTGAPALLLAATEDRLHQRYREPAMRESADLVGQLRAAGLAAVISGAGPTVLVLCADSAQVEAALAAAPADWRAWAAAVGTGASVH